MKKGYILSLIFLLSFLNAQTESQQKAIVIVANSIDYDNEYRQFFERNNVLAFYVSPKRFSEFKQYANILILGGPEAPQTGEIVTQILAPSEAASLRQKGNIGFFEKRGVWTEPQRIFIVAGWDRHATSEAVWKNIKYVLSSLQETTFLSSSGEILWMKDDFEGGFGRAKVEDKLVLVYVWASWCQWCQKMEDEVFSDVRVKEVMTKYYIPVRLDYDKIKNADFAHSHYIWGTPAFLVFDKEGKQVGFMDGYQDTERFLSRLLKYVVP